MSVADLIAEHRLEPHPFEGWWRQTRLLPGKERAGLHLLSGLDEVPWHGIGAEVSYTLLAGGPVSVSTSPDGQRAAAHRLVRPADQVRLAEGALHALSCLGPFALLEVTLRPDLPLTARHLMPDDWYPQPGGRARP